MRRGIWLVLVVTFLLANAGPIAACGDKFLGAGRGPRFSKVYAAIYPGRLLMYAPPKGELADMKGLDKALRRAGHVMIAKDLPTFTKALQDIPVDIVLVDNATSPRPEASPGNRRQAVGGPGLQVGRQFPEDAGRNHEVSAVAAAVHDWRPMMTRAFSPSPSSSLARRRRRPKPGCVAGRGDDVVRVLRFVCDEHDLNGLRDPNSDIFTQSLLADVTWGVRDNLAVTVSLPIVRGKYISTERRHTRPSRTMGGFTPR